MNSCSFYISEMLRVNFTKSEYRLQLEPSDFQEGAILMQLVANVTNVNNTVYSTAQPIFKLTENNPYLHVDGLTGDLIVLKVYEFFFSLVI